MLVIAVVFADVVAVVFGVVFPLLAMLLLVMSSNLSALFGSPGSYSCLVHHLVALFVTWMFTDSYCLVQVLS